MINYLRLETTDSGGAGISALKRVEGLSAKGVNAKLVVLRKTSESSVCEGFLDSGKPLHRAVSFLLRSVVHFYKKIIIGTPVKKYNFFDVQLNCASAKGILKECGFVPDIICVGWVTDFVSMRTIEKLKEITGAKVYFVMADNSPITGGCHYPWGCKGYTEGCFPCPALSSNNKRAHKTLEFKKRHLTRDMIISGSSADCERAKNSYLFRDNVIVPSAFLSPIQYEFAKEDGRNKWGISQDDRVIFCGATYITTERKGFQYLYKSLEHLKTLTDVSNVTVLAAGTDSAKLQLPSGYQVKRVGKLSFEDLFRAYFCSDLFVCPSLEDSGPMMINYSVASCIPVVCYKMGIADDIVRHKENGYIASWGDWKDFAEGILYCLENPMPKQELKILANEIMEDLKEHRSIRKYLGLPS